MQNKKKSKDWEEQRKYRRRHLIYYLEVLDALDDSVFGRLIDITIGGIMVVSKDLKQKDKIYHLRVVLPKRIKGKKQLFLDARCAWCQEDSNTDSFAAGFELQNVEEKIKEIIKLLIDEFSFEDND